MKKIFFCCLVMSLFMFSACTGREYSVYEKINKRYYDLPSYKAEGTITYYSNKTKNKYTFIEYYNGKDKHMIHYTDDDLKVYLRKDGVFSKHNQSDEAVVISDTDDGYRYIFPDSFFADYYLKETSSFDGSSKYVTLETDCSGDSISSIKMWIDTSTLDPSKIQIYDLDSEIVCEICFDLFKTDEQFADEIFVF